MSQSLDELRQWIASDQTARAVCDCLLECLHWPMSWRVLATNISPLVGEGVSEERVKVGRWYDMLKEHGILEEIGETGKMKLLVDLKELLRVEQSLPAQKSQAPALGAPHGDGAKTPRVRPRITDKRYALFGKEFGLTMRHARVLLELYFLLQRHGEKLIERLQLKVYRHLQDTADPLALTTMASMGVAFNELQRKAYLRYEGYERWKLTEEGIRVAKQLQSSWEAIHRNVPTA